MLRPQVPRKAFGGRSVGPKGVSSSFATHPTWKLNTGLPCNVIVRARPAAVEAFERILRDGRKRAFSDSMVRRTPDSIRACGRVSKSATSSVRWRITRTPRGGLVGGLTFISRSGNRPHCDHPQLQGGRLETVSVTGRCRDPVVRIRRSALWWEVAACSPPWWPRQSK
jgi:hypothetical protein